MKKLFLSAFFIGMLCVVSYSFANTYTHIKLAIFDDPQPDPSRPETSQQLKNSYLAGINTAIQVAASQGIHIQEKEFLHGSNVLDLIQQASNVKVWKPDVIIGLNESNEFLMSKAFFGDQLILSLSATDPALSTMPKSFYSLGIPDTDTNKAILRFINEHYPNANLFITVAAENKESVDFADVLANMYRQQHPNRHVVEREFLTDDMETMNIERFMHGYQPGDVIVLMAMGYYSGIDLMNKITQYVSPT